MLFKRIAALITAILFIMSAITALVLAVVGAPINYLIAALLCLVLLPVFFYAMNLITQVLNKEQD